MARVGAARRESSEQHDQAKAAHVQGFRAVPQKPFATVTTNLFCGRHRWTTSELWLTPVLASPPVPIGTFSQTMPFDAMVDHLDEYVAYTPVCNVTGQPAMSVPLYWTADGLPVGSQFIGRFGDEATLLRLAAQLEEARPWAHRWPPASAVSATSGRGA